MRRIRFLIAALLLAATSLQAQNFITNLVLVGSKDYKEARDAVAFYESKGYKCIDGTYHAYHKPQILPPFYRKCYRQIATNLTVIFCGNIW